MIGSVIGAVALLISCAVGAYTIRDFQGKARQARADAEEKKVHQRVEAAVTDALERARVDGIEKQLAELRKRAGPSGDGGSDAQRP